MTVGGTPSVYYGDEQGWTGVKQDVIQGDAEVLRLHRELVALRRKHSWLHRASLTGQAVAGTLPRSAVPAHGRAVIDPSG